MVELKEITALVKELTTALDTDLSPLRVIAAQNMAKEIYSDEQRKQFYTRAKKLEEEEAALHLKGQELFTGLAEKTLEQLSSQDRQARLDGYEEHQEKRSAVDIQLRELFHEAPLLAYLWRFANTFHRN